MYPVFEINVIQSTETPRERVLSEAGHSASPFGVVLVARSSEAIAHVSFVDTKDRQSGFELLNAEFPHSEFLWNDRIADNFVANVFKDRADPLGPPNRVDISLYGTVFQISVWKELMCVPFGTTVSYSRLAESLGRPTATRAVASAVARNRIGFLVPCHRVIRENGEIGEFRWGSDRKRQMLDWENKHRESFFEKADSSPQSLALMKH